MARPRKRNIDFFYFDRGETSEGPFIKLIMGDYGWAGLGRYVRFCDIAAQEEFCEVDLSDPKFKAHVTTLLGFGNFDELDAFVATLQKLKLIEKISKTSLSPTLAYRSFESTMKALAEERKRKGSQNEDSHFPPENKDIPKENGSIPPENAESGQETVFRGNTDIIPEENPGFGAGENRKKVGFPVSPLKNTETDIDCKTTDNRLSEAAKLLVGCGCCGDVEDGEKIVARIIELHSPKNGQLEEAIKRAAFEAKAGRVKNVIGLLMGPTAFKAGKCEVTVNKAYFANAKKPKRNLVAEALSSKDELTTDQYLTLPDAMRNDWTAVYNLVTLQESKDFEKSETGRWVKRDRIDTVNPGQAEIVKGIFMQTLKGGLQL